MHWPRALIFFSALSLTSATIAQTAPADPSLDWLMTQAKPVTPTSQPATLPTGVRDASPLVSQNRSPAGLPAALEMSDGRKLKGALSTTPGRPIRIWDEEAKQYIDVPLARILLIEAEVVWERDEREWQFKQAGSDDKVYSGKTYPARELAYTITLTTGKTLHGGVVAPLSYVDPVTDESQVIVLHKRDKGSVGQSLQQLVYVKRIQFDAPTTRPAP